MGAVEPVKFSLPLEPLRCWLHRGGFSCVMRANVVSYHQMEIMLLRPVMILYVKQRNRGSPNLRSADRGLLHGRAIVHLASSVDSVEGTESGRDGVRNACGHLERITQHLRDTGGLNNTGHNVRKLVANGHPICYSAFQRGRVVSARLSQSPVSSDCAFGPMGRSVSSRYTFPFQGLARRCLFLCFITPLPPLVLVTPGEVFIAPPGMLAAPAPRLGDSRPSAAVPRCGTPPLRQSRCSCRRTPPRHSRAAHPPQQPSGRKNAA